LVLVLAAILNNHASARLDHRVPLMVAAVLHPLAAAAWIGGIPYLLVALQSGGARLTTGRPFSPVCMVAVPAALAAVLVKSWFYIAAPDAVYGTAYGIMTATKALLFVVLVTLGAFNFFALRRANAGPDEAFMTRRRAEVELALGLAVFFAAASMTSM